MDLLEPRAVEAVPKVEPRAKGGGRGGKVVCAAVENEV